MAGKSAVMSVRIVADAKKASGELSKFEKSIGKLEGAIDAATPYAAAAGAGLLAFGTAAGKAAADAEQNFGAVNTVFDKSAQRVHDWATNSAQELGLASSDYEKLAASIGGSLSKAGYDSDTLASKTNDLITAGADLSSVFGGDAAGAAEAMGAALRGEFDPLERYGVFMNAAAIEARMAAEGTDQLTGSARDAAYKQAAVNEIMEQASTYQGNFAREADTAAGAQQRAAAEAQNAAAALGELLLPYLTQGARILSQVLQWVTQNEQMVAKFAIGLGILAGAVFAAKGALAVFNAAQTAIRIATGLWTAAQWALNVALNANPIGLIVIAIAALVAAFVWAYNNVEWFRNGVDAAVRWISNAWGNLTAWIGDAWNSAISWISDVWNGFTGWVTDTYNNISNGAKAAAGAVYEKFKNAVDSVKGFFTSMRDWIKGVFDKITGWATNIKNKITGLFDNFKLPSMPKWVKDIIGSGDDYLNTAGTWYAPPSDLYTPLPFNLTAAGDTPYIAVAGRANPSPAAPIQEIHNHISVNVPVGADRYAVVRELRTLFREYDTVMGDL